MGAVLLAAAYGTTAAEAREVVGTQALQAQDSIVIPPSVNPANFDSAICACQNFYDYVNGGWAKRTTVPDNSNRVVGLEETWALMQSRAWRLAESHRAVAPTTTNPTIQAAGYLYGSCLADATGLAQGTVGQPDRRSHCVAQTNDRLGNVLSEIYVRELLQQDAPVRAQAQAFFEVLKAAAAERMRAAPWLPDSVEPSVLARLAAMKLTISPPDAWYTDATVKTYEYTGPALSPTDFAANMTALAEAPKLKLPFKPATPSYSERLHVVNVTHTLFLQPPYFDPAGDPASNYGALGSMIGHEIMHAFDATRLKRLVGDVGPGFQERTDRLVAYYNALGEDGKGTLDENIADLAGLLVAYDALERVMQNSPKTRIAGLTPEQRFFVSFANVWRTKRVRAHVGDNHATETARVRGLLPNVPAFARAFGCKTGDSMVQAPHQRIEVW